jgi:teichuronic acid exporter
VPLKRDKILRIRSMFVRNVLSLTVGTGFSQIITLIASPILTRIYNPHEFGVFAFFVSTTSLLAIISTGRYEMSILQPKTDIAAYNIVLWSILLALVSNILLTFLLLVFGKAVFQLLDGRISLLTLYIVPIGSFFSASIQILTYWHLRLGNFKLIGLLRIIQSSIVIIASFWIGYADVGKDGLLVSFVLGSLIASFPIFLLIWERRSLYSFKILRLVARKYIIFPKFMMTSAFLDSFAMQAPIFFITKYFNPAVVGSYSLSNRLVTAPVSIISGAFGQVYLQRVTSMVKENMQEISPIVIKASLILLLVGLMLFGPVFFGGSYVVVTVFGTDWVEAGTYLEVLSLSMFVRFVVSPMSSVFVAISDVKTSAKWQLTYFISTIMVFVLGRDLGIRQLLWLYVVHEIVLYSIYYIIILLSIRKFDNRQVCVG